MSKKTYLPIIFLLIIACGFIPFNYERNVGIDYTYLLVFKQLKAGNWKKWQPQLAAVYTKDSTLIKVEQNSNGFSIKAPGILVEGQTNDGFKYRLVKTINSEQSSYSYVAVPQSNSGKCSIIIGKKGNMYNWLYEALTNKKTDFDALKSYMYDTKAFYGISIFSGKVIDSNILVQKKIVPVAAKNAEVIKVQQELKDYIKLHNIRQEQPVMADIRNVSKDSALVMIGIPIVGRGKTDGKFIFMHLPRNGNMLSAYYKGLYGGRQKVYQALKNYLSDRSMSSPEVPYEKFLNNKIPASDTALVNMQINIPIF